MQLSKKELVLSTLKQRSTMLGIVGGIVALLSVMGVDLDPAQRTLLLEGALLVVSVVAIVVQPKTMAEVQDAQGTRSDDTVGG